MFNAGMGLWPIIYECIISSNYQTDDNSYHSEEIRQLLSSTFLPRLNTYSRHFLAHDHFAEISYSGSGQCSLRSFITANS